MGAERGDRRELAAVAPRRAHLLASPSRPLISSRQRAPEQTAESSRASSGSSRGPMRRSLWFRVQGMTCLWQGRQVGEQGLSRRASPEQRAPQQQERLPWRQMAPTDARPGPPPLALFCEGHSARERQGLRGC